MIELKGKGHYWAIHAANVDDFKKGDFRRRKAQRKVRKHMGLAVDEEDSPTPPSSPIPHGHPHHGHPHPHHHGHPHGHPHAHHMHPHQAIQALSWTHMNAEMHPHFHAQHPHHIRQHPELLMTSLSPSVSSDDGMPRKRLFDVASLLGRNPRDEKTLKKDPEAEDPEAEAAGSSSSPDPELRMLASSPEAKRVKMEFDADDGDVDVVSEDPEDSDAEDFRPEAPENAENLSQKVEKTSKSSNVLVSSGDSGSGSAGFLWSPSILAPAMRPPRPSYFNPSILQSTSGLPAASGSASGISSSMEQLTKYYEQVAEAMRINCNAAAAAAAASAASAKN